MIGRQFYFKQELWVIYIFENMFNLQKWETAALGDLGLGKN